MVCQNCGAALADGTQICPRCGATVAQPNQYAQANPYANQAQPNQYANPYQNPQQGPAAPAAPKSRMVAGLLGIFLGGFGVHNFYLGFTKKALIQLLVSVLSCGIAYIGMQIWGLIEGIFYLTKHEGYLTDANGNMLTDN